MTKLPERLQALKINSGMMQKEIAAALGVPLRTYQRYERGEGEPNASMLVKMADFFGVTLDDLVGREYPKRVGRG